MNFYVVKRWQKPPGDAVYPCVTLSADALDDFGWKTQFELMLWTSDKTSRKLGPVKILQRDTKSTQLPESFAELPARFCSLGQERSFYEAIARMGAQGVEILSGLRDVVLSPELAFTRSAGFRTSLLRLSEAADNYQRAGVLFGRPARARPARLNFAFEHKFEAFSAPHQVNCHFPELSALPHRVLAFVGRNGTGKTAVMAEIARQLSGVSALEQNGFSPERPEFSRVVAISYSPFGPFRYPPQRTSSYRYCGLFDQLGQGRIDRPALQQRILNSVAALAEEGRMGIWVEALQACGLMEYEPALRALSADAPPRAWLAAMERLSSGHYTAVTILLDCTANLMTNALLLLDEPELYLHPNLMSALMRAIDDLLNEFDAYAILATHSPIILQEIPGRCVHVFSRIDMEPHCIQLDMESFGESLTNITNQVFGAGRGDKNYMQILNDIATGLSEAEVNALFDNRLSLNARAYVRAVVQSTEAG